MKQVLPLLGMLCLAGCATSPPSSLVGSVVPPYPANTRSPHGSCISGDCAYAFGILENRDGVPIRLLAERLVGYENSSPRWIVTDEMEYPKLNAGETLESACFEVGDSQHVVYAIIGEAGGNEKIPAQRWAYRIDQTSGRFVMLNPEKVQCANSGLGMGD